MAKLEIRSGKAAGKVVELTGTTITLGNRRNATVELKDSWVSFNHAQITRQGDRYFIADAHSRAGTFVNDKRIDRAPVPINSGDRILLGKTEIVVVGEPAAAGAPPAAAPAAAAPVPAPMAPPAPAAPDPALTQKIESLERELKQAQTDLKNFREHVLLREKELSEVNEKLLKIQAAPKGDAEEVNRWKKACEDLKEKARLKIEELGRYAKTLEARVAAGGGGDAAALIEKEKEIARLREEVTRVHEEAKQRLLEAAEKLQKESGDAGELEEERKRADDAERDAGILRSKIEDIEAEKKKLEADLKAVRSEVSGYETALEERNKDVERLEAALGAGGDSSAAPADSADTAKLKAELDAERKRAADLEKVIVDLRTQVEEINQDMLEQEDELREEIATLEKKLAEATQPK